MARSSLLLPHHHYHHDPEFLSIMYFLYTTFKVLFVSLPPIFQNFNHYILARLILISFFWLFLNIAVKEILKRCPAEKLISIYKLPSFSSVEEFLQNVATVRGKLKKGGLVDVEAAARIILRDWNEGMSFKLIC